ncbi:FKBP-type peptidyl-prolyl cis-trans isomerase [Flavobacterium gelatinilyticum]|uniref:FKBP-type peptidyl-prolyl cis-trans isomerase n=1 Tax=Flavobacterium gelatinilyticum TaxID=3003260 RepID=UPI00248001CF|nr:hypothetical protein [Flavobacterium gelatinilyticum]
MNKFKYYFILLLAGAAIVSCNKSDDDDVVTVPLRDYAEQYKADNDSIVKYLKTNYMTVTADLDVTFAKIPAGGTQQSIWDQKEYPLKTREVYDDAITYTVYYISFNEGTVDNPMNTDRIYASYTGYTLGNVMFDSSYNVPGIWDLDGSGSRGVFVDGWKEIFPQFKTAKRSDKPGADGAYTYTGYGAGVMFLPSGLAYYASAGTKYAAYSPMIFSFKLFDLTRLDHDFDGIYDVDEDLNGDGYVYDFRNTTKYPNPPADLIDDTDKDGIPDFLDADDDNDGYSTLYEITKPDDPEFLFLGGLSKYYPYNPIADNPDTPNYDESEIYGIPRRPTGDLTNDKLPESIDNPRKFVKEDFEAPGRKRIHLDNTYPYQKR